MPSSTGSETRGLGRAVRFPPPPPRSLPARPAPHLHAAVPQLLLRRGVPAVIHRLLALHELLGAEGKEGER